MKWVQVVEYLRLAGHGLVEERDEQLSERTNHFESREVSVALQVVVSLAGEDQVRCGRGCDRRTVAR